MPDTSFSLYSGFAVAVKINPIVESRVCGCVGVCARALKAQNVPVLGPGRSLSSERTPVLMRPSIYYLCCPLQPLGLCGHKPMYISQAYGKCDEFIWKGCYVSVKLTLDLRSSSVQFSCSIVSNSATPWTAACQASLSITKSQTLLKLMSIKLVMPFNHLIHCCPPSPPTFNLSQHQGLFQ